MSNDLFPNPNSLPTASNSPSSRGHLPAQGFNEPEGEVDLRVYYRAIMLAKWKILSFALVIGLIAGVVANLQVPLYTAKAKLLIDTSEVKTVSIDEVYNTGVSRTNEFVATQMEILKSPEVVERVVAQLSLHTNKFFDPRQQEKGVVDGLKEKIFGATDAEYSDQAARRYAANLIRANVQTNPIRGSQLVEIQYTSPDSTLSARIANALAEALIDNDLDTKFSMTQKATGWMNERLVGLKQSLSESEKQLQQYRDKKGLVDTSGVVATAAAQLSGTTSQLIEARAERARLQASYERVRTLLQSGGDLSTEPSIARTETVIQSKTVLTSAERNLAEVSERYGPQHPTYRKADAELRAARQAFSRELQLAAAGIQKDYESADATVRAIQQTVSSAKSQVASVNRNQFELAALEREVETNRQLYDMFLGRLKETTATDGLQKTMGRIVEPAVNGFQTFPKVQRTALIALILSALLGMAIAVLRVLLDNTIRTTEEVETKLRSPLLGAVPFAKKGTNGVKTIMSDPKGIFAESFRTLRTGVQLSNLGKENFVLCITSSVPGEGKSTVSTNLALVQSQTKKTVLIDCDMRRPALGRDLVGDKKGSRKPGVSDLLAGLKKLDEVVMRLPDTNLDLISAGHSVPNPLDLLMSAQFRALIETLRAKYEVVIIDTPPVRLVSDVQVICELVDSAIYVVQADRTPVKMVQRGLAELNRTGVKLTGVVLNKQDVKKADRYYGEYSGYGEYSYKSYYGA